MSAYIGLFLHSGKRSRLTRPFPKGSKPDVTTSAAQEVIGPLAAEESISDDDPILLLGTDPITIDMNDASIRHDEYLY